MSLYPCVYELERWGEFQIRSLEGLGYSGSSPLAWLVEGKERVKYFGGRVPTGTSIKGFDEYLLVERALNGLGDKYRLVAIAEYVAPLPVVGKSMVKRASSVGVSSHIYRRRLKRIHEEVCRIFDL